MKRTLEIIQSVFPNRMIVTNNGKRLLCISCDFLGYDSLRFPHPSLIEELTLESCHFEGEELSEMLKGMTSLTTLRIINNELSIGNIVLYSVHFQKLEKIELERVSMEVLQFRFDEKNILPFKELLEIRAPFTPLQLEIVPARFIDRTSTLFPFLKTLLLPESPFLWVPALRLPNLEQYDGTALMKPDIFRKGDPRMNADIFLHNKIYNAWHAALYRRVLIQNETTIYSNMGDGRVIRREKPYFIRVDHPPPNASCMFCVMPFVEKKIRRYNDQDGWPLFPPLDNSFLDNPYDLLFLEAEATCVVTCNEKGHSDHYAHRRCYSLWFCHTSPEYRCLENRQKLE